MGRKQREREAKTAQHCRSAPARANRLNVAPSSTTGAAPAHNTLADDLVHIFVDDQNLFWGLVNHGPGLGFRVDFGELLNVVSRDANGHARAVGSAYIAGVIPDDDSFWEAATNQGFVVRRGYLGKNNRSKQDDSHLITEMVSTVFARRGPSTIILVAGDADYGPPLKRSLEMGWRNEVAFINAGSSKALLSVAHNIRVMNPSEIELLRHNRRA